MATSYWGATPKTPHPDTHAELSSAIPYLTANDKSFALSLLDGHNKYHGWSDKQFFWAKKMIEKAVKAKDEAAMLLMTLPAAGDFDPVVKAMVPAPVTPHIDLSQIDTLMKQAKIHLKNPAILVNLANSVVGCKVVKIKPYKGVEGEYAVVSDGYPSKYFGKITANGTWVPKFSLADESKAIIGKALAAFAADPMKVAAAYGHLHGNCCFCNKKLTDPQSTTVGYGPVCAGHWGLAWGHAAPKASSNSLLKSLLAKGGMQIPAGGTLKVTLLNAAPKPNVHITADVGPLAGSLEAAHKALDSLYPAKPSFLKPLTAGQVAPLENTSPPPAKPAVAVLNEAVYRDMQRKVEYLF